MTYNIEIFDSRNSAMLSRLEARNWTSAKSKVRRLSVLNKWPVILRDENGGWAKFEQGTCQEATALQDLD